MLPDRIPASEIRAAIEDNFKRSPEFENLSPEEQSLWLRALRTATYVADGIKVGESRQQIETK